MGREIERKFLVSSDAWRHQALAVPYAQGYLCKESGRTVRIRIAGEKGFVTIKGPVTGISRDEYEYPIPLEDAEKLLSLCQGPIIRKQRTRVPHAGKIWEVDEFEGANAGLVVAEVELTHPSEEVSLPGWTGKEVTGDPRYYNSNLTIDPFCNWAGKTF